MRLNGYCSISERAKEIGRYIVEHRATVREAADEYGISKSTCYKDVSERLPKYDAELAEKVKDVLEYNKSVRHIRGGLATKRKYELKRRKQREYFYGVKIEL